MAPRKEEGSNICKEAGCGLHFSARTAFKAHQRKHSASTIDCPFCAKKFLDQTNLNRHKNAAHRSKIHPDEEEKQWWCITCAKAFGTRRDNAKRHQKKEAEKGQHLCALQRLTTTQAAERGLHIDTPDNQVVVAPAPAPAPAAPAPAAAPAAPAPVPAAAAAAAAAITATPVTGSSAEVPLVITADTIPETAAYNYAVAGPVAAAPAPPPPAAAALPFQPMWYPPQPWEINTNHIPQYMVQQQQQPQPPPPPPPQQQQQRQQQRPYQSPYDFDWSVL